MLGDDTTMFKRVLTVIITSLALFCFTISAEAASNNWIIYWYVCGSNLESGGHLATKDIAEMQQVHLPSNVKILINAGGTTQWHHPTLKEGGDGIYLYSSNNLKKVASFDFKANIGNPATLTEFLRFGEENIRFGKDNTEKADHRMFVFWNHGGLGGVCFDDDFPVQDGYFGKDNLTYDELKSAFADVYGNSPEIKPFELISFKACLTGSYELANSIADFSNYMIGAEPSIYDTPTKEWISALANNPSISGAKIGKIICDSSMKNFSDDMRLTHIFSVIDLNKMPELRLAYEEYFDEAFNRSDEEGFMGAFARAAEAGNVDKYSNLYTDLGLLAQNTKSFMPNTSNKLLNAINEAVVYNKRGNYLKSKGISTYYPYISTENKFTSKESPQKAVEETIAGLENVILKQNANCESQKELYKKLLNLTDMSAFGGTQSISLELNSKDHFVANLTSEQLEKISSVRCILFPVKESDTSELGLDLGGAILTSADDLKFDWKTGVVTENFHAVEPLFDGHKITLQTSIVGRGYTFYKIPIIYNNTWRRDLLVRYDTSTKKYSIVGFGADIENGIIRDFRGKPNPGDVITPLHLILSDDPSNELLGIAPDETTGKAEEKAMSIVDAYTDPKTGKTVYTKWIKGAPFVYTRDSAVTNRQITNANYLYMLVFGSPSGYAAMSLPGAIQIEHGKVQKISTADLMSMAE